MIYCREASTESTCRIGVANPMLRADARADSNFVVVVEYNQCITLLKLHDSNPQIP